MNTKLFFALAAMVLLLSVSFEGHASISGSPKDSVAYYMEMGKAAQEGRTPSIAWQYYDKAAKLDGKNADIQLAIADVCLKMNRLAPAIRALDSATKLRPTDYATQCKLVQLYFHYDQSAKVVELLPALHQKFPETKDWAYMVGKSYQLLQNFGKAISYLETAVKEDSLNADAYYRIGQMYMLMENYRRSIPYYKHSLALDSLSNPTHTYELALVLSNAEEFESSLRYFQKAVDRGYKPRDDFYMNMAQTLSDANKTDTAITILSDMLARRPGDLGILNGLAEISFQSKRYEGAIHYWEEVYKIDNNARTLYALGTANIKAGREKEGQAMCEQAISMDRTLGVLKHARSRAM